MTIYADASEGPAITTIEYGIDPKTAEEFLQTTRNEADPPACRRDWLEASARLRRPQRYVEIFVTESWAGRLRQHKRINAEDREA